MICSRTAFIIIALFTHQVVDSQKQDGRSLRKSKKQKRNQRDGTPSSYPTYSFAAPLQVDYLYTYGAPSITHTAHQSNPNNACIPGIRAYTEDMTLQTTTCKWYQFWCTPGSGMRSTNVDFASQINADDGYIHPKMDTLILRKVDGVYNYVFEPCRDETYRHAFQWWPGSDVPSDMIPGFHIHSLEGHYETRLMNVPSSVSGPMLNYASAAQCIHSDSVSECLRTYKQHNLNNVQGVTSLGYEVLAQMYHESKFMTSTDKDGVIVLKKDVNKSYRKCIIAFQGSDDMSDLMNFVGRNNNPTSYCGRSGIHSGVKDELWAITHNSQYSTVIKPALETCHEMACVGHSLGGSLCNLFTMCANQGRENLDSMGYTDEAMWDDYHSLIWTKMTNDAW